MKEKAMVLVSPRQLKKFLRMSSEIASFDNFKSLYHLGFNLNEKEMRWPTESKTLTLLKCSRFQKSPDLIPLWGRDSDIDIYFIEIRSSKSIENCLMALASFVSF